MLKGKMTILDKIGGMEVSSVRVGLTNNCVAVILKEEQDVEAFYEQGRPLYGYVYDNGFAKIKVSITNPNVVSNYPYKSIRIVPITPNMEEQPFINAIALEKYHENRRDKTVVMEPSLKEQKNFDFKETEEYKYHLETLTW